MLWSARPLAPFRAGPPIRAMSLLSDLRRYRWLLRLNQPALAFVHDVVMAALSFGLSVAIAYQLRFG